MKKRITLVAVACYCLLLAPAVVLADPPTCHFKIYACHEWPTAASPDETETENKVTVHVFDGVDGGHLFATWEIANFNGPKTSSTTRAGEYAEAHCRYSNCDIKVFEVAAHGARNEHWIHDYCGDFSIINKGVTDFTMVAGQACTNVTLTTP